MKRVLKKLLIVILIILMISNFFMSNCVSAAVAGYTVDSIFDIFGNILGGIIGILTWPLRLTALAAGWVMKEFTVLVAFTEGATDGGATNTITPFDIFFNRVKILQVDFFDIGTEDNFVNTMRTSVASWYYVMRILASAILLVILIYVGIRMAISTIASDRAMYKKMLVDWVASIALIFVLQYIIIFTITANNAIVKVIGASVNGQDLENTYKAIASMGQKPFDLNAIAATIIYCMLVWQTLGLVFAYFSRMLKTAFLIIIAPLITLTYSIDKMGDGKAQALNTWLKEFVFTVLIQPFHCIIYMCLIDMAFKLLSQASDATQKLARAIIAMLMIRFVKEAEKIIRKIFAFKDDNSKTSVAAGMAAAAVGVNQAKNFGKNTRKAVNSAKSFGKNVANFGRTAHVEAVALKRLLLDKDTKEDGSEKSFSDRKEEVRTEINNKQADKIANRTSAIQGIFNKNARFSIASKASVQKRADWIQMMAKADGKEMSKEEALEQAKKEQFAPEVEEEKQRIKQERNGAISDEEAESIARLNVAKKHTMRGKAIKGVKGRVDKIKTKVGQSEVLRELGALGKMSATAGVGLMIGSGIYGTGGNVATALGVGAATFKGTQDFLTSSGRTISNGVSRELKEMGIDDAVGARFTLDDIVQNAEKYDGNFGKGTKALEELNKQLGEMAKNFQGDQRFSKFQTNVMNILSTAPQDSSSKIKKELEKFKSQKGVYSGDMTDDQINAINGDGAKLLEYANKTSIQSKLKQSEDLGMDKNALIIDIAEEFTNVGVSAKYEKIINDSRDIREESEKDLDWDGLTQEELNDKDITKDVLTVKEFNSRKQDIDIDVSRLSDKQLEKLDKMYDEKIKKLTQRSGDDIQRQIDQLMIEQADIIGKALTSARRELDTENTVMYEKYQRMLDEAAKKLQTQINAKEQEIAKMDRDDTSKIYQGKNVQLSVLEAQRDRIMGSQKEVSRIITKRSNGGQNS